MLSRYKRHFTVVLVLIFMIIIIAPGHQAGAYVSTPLNIRIGLFYASGSKDTTLESVTMSAMGGLEIGTNQYGNYTKLIETPYIVNAFVDGGVSGYHIRVSEATADATKLSADLNSYLSLGLEAFPVCLENNLWQIWEGCYLSQGDAERAVSSKIIPKLGNGNYTISLPSTDRIIIKYSNGLAAAASESNVSFLMLKSAFNGDPKTISVNGKRYRTSIELRKFPGSNITVINELTMMDYLGGVVPLEIGTTDTPFEALKAQAVAARTYAVANHKHQDLGFDLCNSTCCQVYGGYEVENLATNNAIKATEGMVVTYGGVLAQLYYFASSGGATANSENVWSKAVPYLQSVEDPYEETKYWSYTFTAEEMTRHMANIGRNIGTVTKVEALSTSESGRVVQLKVTGTTGNAYFERVSTRSAFPTYLPSQVFSIGGNSGYTVKNADNQLQNISISGARVQTATGTSSLPGNGSVYVMDGNGRLVALQPTSTSSGDFTITGAGAGHGVGMSQRGAMGMASAGFTYVDILKHYFTGVEVEKANFY
jgi:stage II sporulation protein D